MYLVAAHSWQKDEDEVAQALANSMDILIFEARQKISNGGPTVLRSYADRSQADELAARLAQVGIPVLIIDPAATRRRRPFQVSRFRFEAQFLQLESSSGEQRDLDYNTIDLLLAAIGSSELKETTVTVTERRFSLGKTLLAGGLPMSKKVKRDKSQLVSSRDETVWLYAGGAAPAVFNRATLNFDGLADALLMTRNLNFTHLKNELRRLAPQAVYDDRLLRRASVVRLLGSTLDPERDLDLAFEIVSHSLLPNP